MAIFSRISLLAHPVVATPIRPCASRKNVCPQDLTPQVCCAAARSKPGSTSRSDRYPYGCGAKAIRPLVQKGVISTHDGPQRGGWPARVLGRDNTFDLPLATCWVSPCIMNQPDTFGPPDRRNAQKYALTSLTGASTRPYSPG